jgi:hypothetical protein
MNRRDFCKLTGGVFACSLLPIPALAKPAPSDELDELLYSLSWNKPQLIFVCGKEREEKYRLVDGMQKYLHPPRYCRGAYIVHEINWDAKKSIHESLKLARRCREENITIIGLPHHLTTAMMYQADLVFDVAKHTGAVIDEKFIMQSTSVHVRVLKNRYGIHYLSAKMGPTQTRYAARFYA